MKKRTLATGYTKAMQRLAEKARRLTNVKVAMKLRERVVEMHRARSQAIRGRQA